MKGQMNLLQKLGLCLILCSCVLLLGSEISAVWNRSVVQDLTQQLQACLPEGSEGDPGQYSDTNMPVLQLKGKDFSGLIQVPAFGVTLPIGSSWEASAISKYPHRFWGSAYDNSLIIGGSSQKGQFDFCEKMDLGDKITITDMTGTEFSYEVVRIDRRKNVQTETLQEGSYDLTLFVQDRISRAYIIARCMFCNGSAV